MRNPFTGEDYRHWRKKGLLPAHALWVTNKTPVSKFHFLAVVHPRRPSEPEPKIERVDDYTVRL